MRALAFSAGAWQGTTGPVPRVGGAALMGATRCMVAVHRRRLAPVPVGSVGLMVSVVSLLWFPAGQQLRVCF